MIHLSIVVPSYNSSSVLEKNLPYLKSYLDQQNYAYEVIVVDDGSEDREQTQEVVLSMGLRYLRMDENCGKGCAVRHGILHAEGDFVIFTDADVPFETSAISLILKYLDLKEFDLVIGDRGLEESEYFSRISSNRRFGSSFFTFFVGRFVTTGFSDTQCGLKGFRAEVAKKLFSVARINGFTFDVELLYIALKWNLDIKKIPVKLRSQDGSSVNIWRHGFRMVWDLLVIKFNHLRNFYRKK